MTTETTKRPSLDETAGPRHDLDPIDAMGWLYDAHTGEALRPAARAEREASVAAAARDGGAGVILLDNDGNLVDVGGHGAGEARRVYVADVAPTGAQADHPAEREAVEVIDAALGALKRIAHEAMAVNLPGVLDQVERVADEVGLPRGDETGAEEARLAWWDRIGLSRLYDLCEFIRGHLRDGLPTDRDEEIAARVRDLLDDAGPNETAEAGLTARVEALEARFDNLVEALAGEVRTRRLVVVDDQGKECITTFISDAETALDVTHPRATDLTAGLFVSCSSAEQDFVGVVAHADGENLVLLEGAVDKERAADGEAAGRLLLRGDLARRGEHVRYGLDGMSVRP